LISYLDLAEPELLSRRGAPYHDVFPELVAEVARLPDLAVDGELVMLGCEGRSQFGELVVARE
jgi:ATP-dependent DNA ligase